jgi:transcriptional regulator GlxA family with amidase domain
LRKRIAVLVDDGCIASMVSAILDVFFVASKCLQNWYLDDSSYGYDVFVVSSEGREVKTVNGNLVLVDTDFYCSVDYDLIVIVDNQIFNDGQCLRGIDSSRLTNWIKNCYFNGCYIFSIGEAIHLLAKSGVLTNQIVAVAPHNYAGIKKLNEKVKLSNDSFAIDKKIITVQYSYDYMKGLFSYLNKRGEEQVVLACNEKINQMGLRPINLDEICKFPYFDHEDLEIKKVQIWFLGNFTKKISIGNASSEVGMGDRNFKRRFKIATGKTPTYYLQDIRVKAAKRWLEDTNLPVIKISENVGYADFSSFCKLFKKHTGQSMGLYRKELRWIMSEGKMVDSFQITK